MQTKTGTDQKDPRKELTGAERRLVESVKQLKQRRKDRWQEKVLQEGSSTFAIFALF